VAGRLISRDARHCDTVGQSGLAEASLDNCWIFSNRSPGRNRNWRVRTAAVFVLSGGDSPLGALTLPDCCLRWCRVQVARSMHAWAIAIAIQ